MSMNGFKDCLISKDEVIGNTFQVVVNSVTVV